MRWDNIIDAKVITGPKYKTMTSVCTMWAIYCKAYISGDQFIPSAPFVKQV